jgi:hypothetical protein
MEPEELGVGLGPEELPGVINPLASLFCDSSTCLSDEIPPAFLIEAKRSFFALPDDCAGGGGGGGGMLPPTGGGGGGGTVDPTGGGGGGGGILPPTGGRGGGGGILADEV